MLRKHRKLYADLAFRNDHASGGKIDPAWREAFIEFPDRFLVGTDTFTPERWYYIAEHADWSRAWLADLPPDIAERIGWRNGETLFACTLEKTRQTNFICWSCAICSSAFSGGKRKRNQ